MNHEALCKESQLLGHPYKVHLDNHDEAFYKDYLLYDDTVNGKLSNSDAARSFACLFCGEETNTTKDTSSRHLWRYMEEIAFTVVSKPYKKGTSIPIPQETMKATLHLAPERV
jgi:hypothetical protein